MTRGATYHGRQLDGKRIVALMPVETADGQKTRSHVIFLDNFFDDVRRKVPVGK
jgi:hypothetical protein